MNDTDRKGERGSRPKGGSASPAPGAKPAPCGCSAVSERVRRIAAMLHSSPIADSFSSADLAFLEEEVSNGR